jgi:hypothetical protein
MVWMLPARVCILIQLFYEAYPLLGISAVREYATGSGLSFAHALGIVQRIKVKAEVTASAFITEPFPARGGSNRSNHHQTMKFCHGLSWDWLVFCKGPLRAERTIMSNQKIGRDAGNGQFTTVKEARQQPKTHVVETIKRPPTPAPKPKSK